MALNVHTAGMLSAQSSLQHSDAHCIYKITQTSSPCLSFGAGLIWVTGLLLCLRSPVHMHRAEFSCVPDMHSLPLVLAWLCCLPSTACSGPRCPQAQLGLTVCIICGCAVLWSQDAEVTRLKTSGLGLGMPVDSLGDSVGGPLDVSRSQTGGAYPIFVSQFCLALRVWENHAGYNLGLLFGDSRLGENFISQLAQALLEFMSLGLNAESKLKQGAYSWQKYVFLFLEKNSTKMTSKRLKKEPCGC